MILDTALGIIVHGRLCGCFRKLPSIIVPHDDLDVLLSLQIVPQPQMIVSICVFEALHTNTAMAGLGSQGRLATAEILFSGFRPVRDKNRRNQMKEIPAVKANGIVAPQLTGPESAGPGAQQELARGSFVKVLIDALGRTRADQQRCHEMPLLIEEQSLRHLVHNDAIRRIGHHLLDPVGPDPSLFQFITVIVRLNLCPSILLIQYMNGNGCAIDKATVRIIGFPFSVRPI